MTAFVRLFMLTALTLQFLLFFIFNLKVIHYVAYPMPKIFSSPSLLFSLNFVPHYLLNAILYSMFFVQHIVMALIGFKTLITRFYSRFPLYQRYIYNIFSCWIFLLLLEFVLPISLKGDIVFVTNYWINAPFLVLGAGLLAGCMLKMGGIFNPFPISQILTAHTIEVYSDDASVDSGLNTSGLYGIVRHPMQLGSTLLILFASPNYTVDRLVFIFVMITGIIVGIIM